MLLERDDPRNGTGPQSFEIQRGPAPAGVVKTPPDPAVYRGRGGYASGFLGRGFDVPLPKVGRGDAAPVRGGGIELAYEHFTVVQSRRRRLCFFSACNLDGARSAPSKRSNTWRYDPRIATKYQLIDECYGTAKSGLFSRGHMTRREDPVWGPHPATAEADTFHATNAVPQMQGHNSPVWLGLEDHVLRNAHRDAQRVSVITGPVLAGGDPVLYGVKVPVQLWKVVAFVHPRTRKLSAVAYLDSQAAYLPTPKPAFVWGQYRGMQVPLARVASLTGLDFGALVDADVLRGAGPRFSLGVSELRDVLLS